MPFGSDFDDVYKFGIKGAAEDVGAYAERLDEQIFTEGMLDRIFNQISKADVIVADMTGRNPNVFYEVGYAHALDKIVLLVTQSTEDIPFDLKHRQHTVYGGSIKQLRQSLMPKLRWAIQECRARQSGHGPEQFQVRLGGLELVEGVEATPLEIELSLESREFALRIAVRNTAPDPLQGISHVYLFLSPDAPLEPSEEIRYTVTGAAGYPTLWPQKEELWRAPLESFEAPGADASDGLTRQYRLPVAFGVIPPGASDSDIISWRFKGDETECADECRLRVHTIHQFYDYRFRLKLTLHEAEESS